MLVPCDGNCQQDALTVKINNKEQVEKAKQYLQSEKGSFQSKIAQEGSDALSEIASAYGCIFATGNGKLLAELVDKHGDIQVTLPGSDEPENLFDAIAKNNFGLDPARLRILAEASKYAGSKNTDIINNLHAQIDKLGPALGNLFDERVEQNPLKRYVANFIQHGQNDDIDGRLIYATLKLSRRGISPAEGIAAGFIGGRALGPRYWLKITGSNGSPSIFSRIWDKITGNTKTATSAPNLTERGTLTNIFPGDPVVLQTKRRTLVQDSSGRYWLEGPNGNRITPSGSYDFVTMPNGTIRVARQNTNQDFSTHLGLSDGGEVSYAGSIRFGNNAGPNRGTITNWTNNSGHYTPPPELSGNAGLPSGSFIGHQ